MNKNLLREKVRFGLAREPDFAELGRDEVLAIKLDNGIQHWRFEARAARAQGDRSYEHDANVESADSMGDLIQQNGWNLRRITMPNSRMSVLLNHDPRPVPAGVVNYGRKGWTQDEPKLRALVLGFTIHELDLYANSEAGRIVEAHHRLMAKKLLTGGSVGFIPTKARPPADDAEREKHGLGPYSLIFEEMELLEYSITSIPAHPSAHDRKFIEDGVRSCGFEPDVADYWFKALTETPEAWIERNAPNLSRTIVALPTAPTWMKGARAEETKEPAGSCCTDAKAALADTVRDVVRAELAPVREDLRVLRSKNSDGERASVPSSRAESTISRGTDAAKAHEAGAAGTPGESRNANPLAFQRRLLEDLLQDTRNLNASGNGNAPDRD